MLAARLNETNRRPERKLKEDEKPKKKGGKLISKQQKKGREIAISSRKSR